MKQKNKKIPREFFSYAETLATMNDEKFANEFVESEDMVEHYIWSVRNNEKDLPSKEQLARAALCLMFSLPEHVKPHQSWNVIHLLAAPEVGVSLYSIEPQISEILFLAKNNLGKLMNKGRSPKSKHASDDLF
ncbi:hypothetical protein [Vreelandella lionensis]|uniref:hypothetical protein n=1 Tax=Halomonadaceae TaxID=28256 RepID=UPI0009F43664|nr:MULTISPECIES: hypothetical protein [Halomonas]MCP1318390.1 hypothetical protein [Halomonas sp. 707B3]